MQFNKRLGTADQGSGQGDAPGPHPAEQRAVVAQVQAAVDEPGASAAHEP